MPRAPSGLVGAAGEYFVAGELSRRGWLATVTIKNAPGTDVLAQRFTDAHTVLIQTKTSAGFDFTLKGPQKIDVGDRVADERAARHDNEWFIFVTLRGDGERSDFYVVPRDVVASMIFLNHRDWLAEGVRMGKKRNDSPMRKMRVDHIPEYRERWDLLEQSTREAPYLGSACYPPLTRRYGLPKGLRKTAVFRRT